MACNLLFKFETKVVSAVYAKIPTIYRKQMGIKLSDVERDLSDESLLEKTLLDFYENGTSVEETVSILARQLMKLICSQAEVC